MNDPFDRLEILRARRWGDDAHQRKLEETLMLEYARRKLVTLTKGKALAVASSCRGERFPFHFDK